MLSTLSILITFEVSDAGKMLKVLKVLNILMAGGLITLPFDGGSAESFPACVARAPQPM
jgi:hypothetical protein